MPDRLTIATLVVAGLAVAVAGGSYAAFAPIAAPAPVAKVLLKPAPKLAVVALKPPAPKVDERFVVRRILNIDAPLRQGDFYWDDTDVPDGPIVLTVDLAAQTLSIFRSGYEIGTAVVIYGGDDHPTPLGVFPITQKDAHHVSNLYDAPMPYMLRLTDGGISIHGSEVGNGYVTHGCVGVPQAFAKKLFGAVKLGDRVFVTRGKMIGIGQAITTA